MSLTDAPTVAGAGSEGGRSDLSGAGLVLSRRRVLQLTAASVLGVALGACSRGGDAGEDALGFWREIAAAARSGDPTLTVAGAEADLVAISPPDMLVHPTRQQRKAIRQQIADDFATGRTVLVSGWLLARTEVSAAVVVAGPRL